MSAATSTTYQPALPGMCTLTGAVEALATGSADERGAIFTRREVVEFILDLVGYRPELDLRSLRLLEPSFGGGDFLFAAVERLLVSYTAAGGDQPARDLASSIRAVELHTATFQTTAAALATRLVSHGMTPKEAASLVDAWLIKDDFLLTELDGGFDVIVGNPPYIRQELIPQPLMDEYRRRYHTIYDRADIYVPFIERSLRLLTQGGALGFICADRWMKNRYGGPLRKLVSDHYHLRTFIDMVDTPAFHSDVIAYPAIFVIANERGSTTRLAFRPEINAPTLRRLALDLTNPTATSNVVTEAKVVASGAEPWLIDPSGDVTLVRRLESTLPTLEEAGCKVGIGVATGSDKAFIGPLDTLDVESDRKLPLVMTKDIASGAIAWRGYGVINPFAENGKLVDLARYPRLKAYLEARKEEIAGRHVAQKAPANWYRTIDRIYPELVTKPKLLIPDIKGTAHIVHDDGRFYPHHNLYFITSEDWDLRALQAVLMSGIARLFIATYSTKMRGGYLRFQAQYLRRIRIPHWSAVPLATRAHLIEAGIRGDTTAANEAVAELYGLRANEHQVLNQISEAA